MNPAGTNRVASDEEPERFGILLRRLRLTAGLSQERLAELARISAEAVGALERGTRKAPQRQTLALLIEALDAESDDREALTLAAIRPQKPRLRMPLAGQSSVAFLHSAPSMLTSFVGREADVTAVASLCRSARLTSIVGAGGVGKSRLALEAGRAVTSSFADGVSVVALAPLLAHAAVLPIVAAALGVRDEGAAVLEERIAAAVGARSILLVLDNCEHVLDELAPAVGLLLAHCPNVHILATTRQRLRVDGERIYRLQPLSIGNAVDVFIDRAAAAGFDSTLSESDLGIAAEICDRLDRVPLAIELVASCSDVLGFGAILARLHERFTLPATPARSALPQHRSMQALVEWSYDRLEPHDALVFRRLAPFAGGCRLDDAQAILAYGTLSKDDLLYALFRLHEQSLVDADRASVPRFQMLQTIRDVANMLLRDEERAAVTHRFARHYLTVVADAERDLRSARQVAAIERLSAESVNVRAAIACLETMPALETEALTALGALSHYWLRTGTLTEGADVYASIDFSAFAPSAGLASALIGASFVELNRKFLPAAHAYAMRGREVARAIADPWYDVYAAIAQHTIAALSDAFPVSESFEPLYCLAVDLGDPWLIGSAAYRMAALAEPFDAVASNGYLAHALTCAETSGDPFAIQSIQLALARSNVHADPQGAVDFVWAVWQELGPSHAVRKLHCVECLAEIAVVLERLDDAAFLTGFGFSLSRRVGAPDAARKRLDMLAERLATEKAAVIASGDRAADADAGDRIAAFVRSVSGLRERRR